MNIPKTQKVTLKRIVEAVQNGSLPDNGFGDPPPPMPSESKKKLMELAAMYENFGECLKNEEALMNSAKGITELCELAETYALNECGEWFQQEIVVKDMKNLKQRVTELQKVIKETYARMQQAGVAYQDIGHILGRYYDLNSGGQAQGQGQGQQRPGPQTLDEEDDVIKKNVPPPPKQLQPVPEGAKKKVTEDQERICAWCKKPMGTAPGTGTGVTHGICPDCRDKMMGDIKKQAPPTGQSPAPEVKESMSLRGLFRR